VDSSGDVGQYTSLSVVNGLKVKVNGMLKVAQQI